MSPNIPTIYENIFGGRPLDPLKEYAGILDVLPADAATIEQAQFFVRNELQRLAMANLNRGLPAHKIIGVEAGRGRYVTAERLIDDGFPTRVGARLMIHFDNGPALAPELLTEEEIDGIGKIPNKAERSESFEICDLIKKFYSGPDGPNQVWAQIQAAVR